MNKMVKKITKKEKLIFTTFYFSLLFTIPIFVISRTDKLTEFSNLIVFLLLIAFLGVHLLSWKYKITSRFFFFLNLILFLIPTSFSASVVYDDFIKYNTIEKHLGINKLVFYNDIDDQDVIKFLFTVDPKYTTGLNEIIIMPSPIFEFSLSLNGEELQRGEASGQFKKETKDIIFEYNSDFKNTFYHEIGHYIHLVRFTNEERNEWESILNISVDYEQFEQLSELSQDKNVINKLLEYAESKKEYIIRESFAIYFASAVLNKSEVPEEFQNYFEKVLQEVENDR